MNPNSAPLGFHSEAAKRFNERVREIMPTVQDLGSVIQVHKNTVDLHPVATIKAEDIISQPALVYEHDPAGEPAGVLWVSAGRRVGWVSRAFQPIKALTDSIAAMKPFRDLVSREFLLQRICEWLSDTLEGRQSCELSQYIELRSNEEVKEYEIWAPLFRTYSSVDLSIGDVTFRTITREIMDEWWGRMPVALREDPTNALALHRWAERRSQLQASLAACVSVRAEKHKAVELARIAAQNATALLRFLSPANLNSRLTSYCTPVRLQAVGLCTELFMNGGFIDTISEGVQDQRDTHWHVDRSLQLQPGVLANLHWLASEHSTEFQNFLYDALILYSRQALAVEISDKLVFTLSALESMLLRDSSEPIQKNLGERMAFLIGQTAQQRKEIVKNIEEIYKIRSAFVHHGQTPRHVDVVDCFLVNAWTTLSRLLDLVPQYRTKAALVGALEDRKMS